MRAILASVVVLLGACGPAIAGMAFHDPIYGVSTTTNIVYGTGPVNNGAGTLDLKLDLYRPVDVGAGALPSISPGIVLIHGGGFVIGDKADLAPIAQIYASYGYTVTSINYRMYFDAPPPNTGPADGVVDPPPPYATVPRPEGIYAINAAVEDSIKAMTWMRNNAALYNIDANHIALGGGSAGAVTSLLEAYNDPPAHAAPQAVLSFLGAMYGTEGTIHAGAPPAFVVHGDLDDTVPFSGAQAVVNQMNAVGVYNEFYVQQGLGHDVDFDLVFDGKTLLEHNMAFLARFLVPESSSLVLFAGACIALAACCWRSRRR